MLTAVEKIEAYRYAKSVVVSEVYTGLCFCLCIWLWHEKRLDVSYEQLEDYFPEVFALRPTFKLPSGHWWPINDRRSRVEALDKAIETVKSSFT